MKKYAFLTKIGLVWTKPESSRSVQLHQLLADKKEALFTFGCKIHLLLEKKGRRKKNGNVSFFMQNPTVMPP